ncbi:glyoxalase [Maribellus comscasis]|uniref:Glyoxalase n=1 Tax=Maribellus comscasis TaxID=2681766 RepID=A0A6I6JW82_9BACT|nr:glyoxalase [Maribellus comscasis]QGY47386.1 glyoxalase [Maribellus comscasis]
MRITELTLLTNNISETTHFYHKLLNFEIADKNTNEVSFKAGSTKLIFKKTDYDNPVYHFTFNIPNNKYEEAFKIIDNSIGVISSVEDGTRIFEFANWNAKSFYFYDNNNNILECIARFDLDNQINHPFKNTDIQSVSEIGINVDDVHTEGQKIINEYNLDYFQKQKPREDFAVIGDDNGLLILGLNNRIWFPTNQRGEKHYTKIKFEVNGKISEVEYP